MKISKLCKNILSCLSLMLLLSAYNSIFFNDAYGVALNDKVDVTIPTFKVTMNEKVINNYYSKYPFIIYKGITYFPMTYNDCRFLGIETGWQNIKTGLFIDSTGISAAYNPIMQKNKNYNSYTATIAQFPITVNGKIVNNNTEQYPLLLFRDVTYFPMTWRWCGDEFNWRYSFDNINGLSIDSSNYRIESICSIDNINQYSDLVICDDKMYYIGNDKKVYQTCINDLNKTKCIFGLPDYEISASLEKISGKCYIRYGNDGLVGQSWLVEASDNGDIRYITSGSYDYAIANNTMYKCYTKMNLMPDNLSKCELNNPFVEYNDIPLGSSNCNDLIRANLPAEEKIGENIFYKKVIGLNSPNNKATQIFNNKILAIAVDSEDKTDVANLYTVDVETGESNIINKRKPNSYYAAIEDRYYYYVSDGSVYRGDIENPDNNEEEIGKLKNYADNCIGNPFVVFGGKVYWRDISDSGQLYIAGSDNPVNSDINLIKMEIIGDKYQYLACYYEESPASRYRFIVYDKSGEIVFKTSDTAATAIIQENNLFYYNLNINALCKLKF